MKKKTPKQEQVQSSDKVNMETLKRAFASGDVLAMRCRDKKTGEFVTLLCAVNCINGEYEMIPLSVLVGDNPFERYISAIELVGKHGASI